MGVPTQMKLQSALVAAVLLPCCTVFAQSPAPAGGARVAATATTTDNPEIHEFQKIEDNWSGAINGRDQYGLELVLSPLFVDISASGDVTTRNQQVAQVINGDDKTLHLDQRVITVRMLGDVAVANGTYVLHHKTSAGPMDEKGIFTHVYQRARNSWLCVNSQRTVLREDGPAGKAKKKSSSDAEMPFHIPLFTKSDKSQ
ncbi:nuclear transport factor 2 family protein [Acidobacteria bacterium AB60]|nr:nuclear transport factor 2 family protein [Acidobacteria bacterium AB60]